MHPDQEIPTTITPATFRWSDICRLCLQPPKLQLFNKFTPDFVPTIVKFLKAVLHDIPNNVCGQCFNDLNQIASFIEKCKNSRSILQQIEETYGKLEPDAEVKVEISDGVYFLNVQQATSAENVQTEATSSNADKPSTLLCDGSESEKCGDRVATLDHQCKMKGFKCSECPRFFTSEKRLEFHLNAQHRKQMSNCHICSETFRYRFALINHIKTKHESREQTKILDAFLVEHSYSKPPQSQANPVSKDKEVEESTICEKCGLQVRTKSDHYKVSRKCLPRNVRCPDCHGGFTCKRDLRNHQKAHHWKETHKLLMCHICSKTFKYQTSLKRHLHVHELSKRFVCEVCGRGFTQNTHLLAHLNVHSGLKPYKCLYCSKSFGAASTRVVHQRIHVNTFRKKFEDAGTYQNGRFVCSVCKKEFLLKVDLIKHCEVHVEDERNRSFLKRWKVRKSARKDKTLP